MVAREDLDNRKRIGGRIREEQSTRGWTDKELAEKIGLTYLSGIAAWKNGSTSIPVQYIEPLSHVLDIPLEEFPQKRSQDGRRGNLGKKNVTDPEMVLFVIDRIRTLDRRRLKLIYDILSEFKEEEKHDPDR